MKRSEKGQGLLEYAIILVIVAIIVITVIYLLGPIIGNVYSNIDCSLGVGPCPPGSSLQQTSRYGISGGDIQQTNNHGNKGGDRLDSYKEFKELSLYQEEALNEAKVELIDGTREALEVLAEYANYIGDDTLYSYIYQAQQTASDPEELPNLPLALAPIFDAIQEAPTYMQVDVVKAVAPSLIKAFRALDGTEVPYEKYEPALQEIQDYPTSTEDIVSQLEGAWTMVSERNELIGQVRAELRVGLCYSTIILYNSGTPEDIELAQEIEAQSPPSPCDN